LLQRARLLTLTGPGGCGKTRLAQELAQVSARGFPDGAWWVDVASLSDSALVPLAVASVLGVPERPEQPVAETLADRLRDRRALLVLEDFRLPALDDRHGGVGCS
jgi:predicted ATPase